MRTVNVPIDMSSEQKNIQGIISTRQAIYIGVGGVILYSYIPFIFKFLFPVLGMYSSLLTCLLLASPILALVGIFGFVKSTKLGVFYDVYLLILISRKTQYGVWRKGD